MLKYLKTLLSVLVVAEKIRQQNDQIISNQREMLKQMSTTNDAIQTFAASVKANFATLGADLGKLKDGVAALDAKILALQASAGPVLSAVDAAALQSVLDDSAALVKQAEGISVAIPEPPVAA